MKETVRHSRTVFVMTILLLAFAADDHAQSSGGGYQITQSVIANGGDQSTTHAGFSVTGTVGQAEAGGQLRTVPYTHMGGFWPGALLSTPTAAPAALSGPVTTANGLPLAGVVMALSGST